MASIIDSARLVFTDNNAPVKIAALSLIPFLIYNLINETFKISNIYDLNTPVMIILGLIYYGYLLQTLNNSIQEKNYTLSKFNPFPSFWAGLKGIIPTAVFICPIYFVYQRLLPMFSELEQTSYIVLSVIFYLIPASFLFMSIILYGKKLNPFAGLNIIKIAKNFHEIIVYLALSVVLLALANLVTALPVGAVVYGLFGNGVLFAYCISVIVTCNLLLFFQNLSHAYFEVVNE